MGFRGCQDEYGSRRPQERLPTLGPRPPTHATPGSGYPRKVLGSSTDFGPSRAGTSHRKGYVCIGGHTHASTHTYMWTHTFIDTNVTTHTGTQRHRHTHTHGYSHSHTYTHPHIHSHLHTHAHTYTRGTHISSHTDTRTRLYRHKHDYIHRYSHTHEDTSTHHTYVQTHTDTHTHRYSHTYTWTQSHTHTVIPTHTGGTHTRTHLPQTHVQEWYPAQSSCTRGRSHLACRPTLCVGSTSREVESPVRNERRPKEGLETESRIDPPSKMVTLRLSVRKGGTTDDCSPSVGW